MLILVESFVDVLAQYSMFVMIQREFGWPRLHAADLSPLIIWNNPSCPDERTSLINCPPRLTRRGCIPETRMSDKPLAAATLATRSVDDGPSTVVFYLAVICLIWYVAVTLVSTLGYVQV